MANLGQLVVNLEANIAKFTSDMGRASQSTEQAMKRMESAANGVKTILRGVGAALTVDLIVGEINKTIDALAGLDDMAQKTGASVETLSKLGKVAAFTSTEFSAVDSVVTKLAKNLAGLDDKGNNTAKALAAIGISTQEIKDQDPAQVFVKIAGKLQDYGDGAGKVALVTDLMGKSAADLLPYMNDVAESIDKFSGESAQAAADAAKFQDELGKMKVKYEEIKTAIVTAALPAALDFIEAIKETARQAKNLTEKDSVTTWADDVALVMARMADGGSLVGRTFKAVNAELTATAANIELMDTISKNVNPIGAAKVLAAGGSPTENIKAAMAKRDAQVGLAYSQISSLWVDPLDKYERAMQSRIDGRSDATYMAGVDGLAGLSAPAAPDKKQVKYSSGDDGSVKDSTALRGRLAAIERAYQQEQDTASYHEKFMRELYDQQLVDVETYNKFRVASIEQARDSAVRAYSAEIAALQAARGAAKTDEERATISAQIAEKVAAKEKAIQDAKRASTQETLQLSAAQSDLNVSMQAWARQQDAALAQQKLSNDLHGKSTVEVIRLTEAKRAQLEVDEAIRRAQEKGPISKKSIDKFNADGKVKADAAAAEGIRGAGMGVMDSLKKPWQQENEEHENRLATLRAYREQELQDAVAANQSIELENQRHAEVQRNMQMSAAQDLLSIAQSSAGQLYDALKAAGLEQTALGKAIFIAQKAIQIASIIVNTEVAAAAAQAGMIAAAGATAAVSGPAGPGILAAGIAAGAAYATATRAMGYATAGIVAGTAIASAEGGFDIPAGVNPVTQLHEKEMVLPKAQAEVIRGLAANGGAGGMKVTIVNQTTGRIDNVIEKQISPTERALIIQEAVAATASTLGDPNSKTSRAMSRNFNVARTRS